MDTTWRASPSCCMPSLAEQFIHREAQRHRAGVADRLVGFLQQFAQEAGAVLQ